MKMKREMNKTIFYSATAPPRPTRPGSTRNRQPDAHRAFYAKGFGSVTSTSICAAA